jgi:hypothetical protein
MELIARNGLPSWRCNKGWIRLQHDPSTARSSAATRLLTSDWEDDETIPSLLRGR